MGRRVGTLTVFGQDLDSLLQRAGKFTLREYADECGVSYKYLLQLRTSTSRRPGRLYVDLLKPFTRLHVLDLAESHRLSSRHRGRPLSLAECRTLFPEAAEQELVESIKNAVDLEKLEGSRNSMVGAEATTSSRERVSLGGQDQLYGHVFVGRQAELNKLRSAFDTSTKGNGALVMVSGEPGIGKTSLCRQVASYVASLSGLSLVGHCYEPEALAVPYLAFIEVLRSHVVEADAATLKSQLGGGASDLARIIPEITDRTGVSVRPRGDPAEEKYRLLQAVADFLGNVALHRPLLVVLEDLHGADLGTMEMLQHVARNLSGKRVLLIGTYRDVEVDRAHPLSDALAELRRLPNFNQIMLRGLSADEVARMLSGIFGRDAPAGVDTAVHGQTEGNPLFVEEVARYLVEEGVVGSNGELRRLAEDMAVEMRIPLGLRDVIGKRLSKLSERCNRVLSAAAVIGRDFPLEILQGIAEMPEADLFNAIGEARKAGILEERTQIGTVRYRFVHGLFRQTLYEEMIAPVRLRVHQQVGFTLEKLHAKQLEEHAAELAEHFSQSTDPADLAKAISYAQMAARRACDVYDFAGASSLLGRALRVQEVLDPTDKTTRCDLLLTIAEASRWIGQAQHSLDVEVPEAFALAEAIADNRRAALACLQALYAMFNVGLGSALARPEATKWIERADRYAQPGTPERDWTDIMAGYVTGIRGDIGKAQSLLSKAREDGKALGDRDLQKTAAGWWLQFGFTPWAAAEGLRIADEAAAIKTTNPGTSIFTYLVHAFLTCGNRRRAEETSADWDDWTSREQTGAMRLPETALTMWTARRAYLDMMDGKLEETVDALDGLIAEIETTGHGSAGVTMWIGVRLMSYLGSTGSYIDRPLWKAVRRSAGERPFRRIPLYQALLGNVNEVNAELDRMLAARPNITTREDSTHAWLDIAYLESAVTVGHHRTAQLLLERFADNTLSTTGHYYPTCVPRHLGTAAALLGKHDEARVYYQDAIRICTEMRFRPELALTRLQLAELLLEHYPDEKKEALDHLDFAIKEFREMKMQPSLERALRRKEILKA